MLDVQTGFLIDELHQDSLRESYARPLSKWCFDYVGALLLLLVLMPVAAGLLLLNPFFNRGPLWFVQDRMGHRCRRFRAIKFRTMMVGKTGQRGAFDRLETDRITTLGSLLRKLRLDELPQVINVLRGEMSLIGPRPDAHDHAIVYLQTIPGYRERHEVLPGISGLAQTEVGYVDGREGVHLKVAADLRYIADLSPRLELWILWRTLVIVTMRRGA